MADETSEGVKPLSKEQASRVAEHIVREYLVGQLATAFREDKPPLPLYYRKEKGDDG